MTAMSRDDIERIVRIEEHVEDVIQWQAKFDEKVTWATRLLIGVFVTTLVTNAIGACFSAAAVIFVLVLNSGQITKLVTAVWK